jgi:hypothetical protein
MANENLFTSSKQSLVIAPKTTKQQAFIYRSMADLENLILFVGNTPKIAIDKGKPILNYGKHTIKDDSVILRNSFGEVTTVLSMEEANAQYDIVAQSEFLPEHKNKVITKPKKEKKTAVKK